MRRKKVNMWISEIKIKNFRPFYGEQKINFEDTSQEKFTVIEANADTGKTTFLSAICWCLYGKDLGENDKETSDSKHRSIHPFNLKRKDELPNGEHDTLQVEITLNNDGDKNPRYVINREAFCVKNGSQMDYIDVYIRVNEWKGHKTNSINDPVLCQKIINSILPEDIHMFFLFEGEKLQKVFSFIRQENIQAAIEKISQIQQVKLAINHLEVVRDKVYIDKDKGKGNTDIERAQKEIETFQERIDALEKQKDIYRGQMESADIKIKEIDEKLSLVNIPLINEWSNKRKDLEKTNEKLEEDLKLFQEEQTESLLKTVPHAMSSKALINLLKKIETTSQRNELPPKIKNAYIKELLDKKMCICGRSLESNKNEDVKRAIDVLNKILNENDLSDLAEKLIEGRYEINNILEGLPNKLIKVRDKRIKDIENIKNKIQENLANIEDLDNKLKENKEEYINAMNNERIILRKSMETQLRSITNLEGQITNFKDEILKRRRLKEDFAKRLKDYDVKKKIADFMDRASEHLDKINNEILKEVRGKVEKKTFDSFLNLHWDNSNYEKFCIDETYAMSLQDSEGNERINDLSGGTKQVLLLSFIAALADVSGFKFPIFIDTPLANTDNTQRMNIAKNLPNYLEGKQVVLLVKDQEYTEKFRTLIKNRVSQEFRFVKTGGKTEVRTWA